MALTLPNLVPSFTSGKWLLNQNATAYSSDMLILQATGTGQYSRVSLSLKPNTEYIIKGEITGDARIRISKNDSTNYVGGTFLKDFWGGTMRFTTPADTGEIVFSFGQRANVGAGTYTITNLTLNEPIENQTFDVLRSLKTNWNSEDYYNFSDLERVDKSLERLHTRILEFYGVNIALSFRESILPVTNSSEGFMDWYVNLEQSPHEFKTGRKGVGFKLIDFTKNPRIRVVATTSNLAYLEKGKTYRYTVVFEASPHLQKVEMASIYYYDFASRFWQEFAPMNITDLEIESEEDNTFRYEVNFVAEETGGVRPSFGFGLGNPNIENGAYVNILKMELVEAYDVKTIPFADLLNRIETNIGRIRTFFNRPKNSIEPKTWEYNMPFDFSDANRLEQNLKVFYQRALGNQLNIPYCGQIIAGQKGVF